MEISQASIDFAFEWAVIIWSVFLAPSVCIFAITYAAEQPEYDSEIKSLQRQINLINKRLDAAPPPVKAEQQQQDQSGA